MAARIGGKISIGVIVKETLYQLHKTDFIQRIPMVIVDDVAISERSERFTFIPLRRIDDNINKTLDEFSKAIIVPIARDIISLIKKKTDGFLRPFLIFTELGLHQGTTSARESYNGMNIRSTIDYNICNDETYLAIGMQFIVEEREKP